MFVLKFFCQGKRFNNVIPDFQKSYYSYSKGVRCGREEGDDSYQIQDAKYYPGYRISANLTSFFVIFVFSFFNPPYIAHNLNNVPCATNLKAKIWWIGNPIYFKISLKFNIGNHRRKWRQVLSRFKNNVNLDCSKFNVWKCYISKPSYGKKQGEIYCCITLSII